MVAVPVLILLEQDDTLRASASAAVAAVASGRPETTGVEETLTTRLPGNIVLDTSYAAIPLGYGTTTTESFAAMSTGSDTEYVVRGVVDSDQLGEFAEHQEGKPRVFADPQIGSFPICPGDPAMGNAADVRGLLNVSELTRRRLNGEGTAVAIVDTGINIDHLRKRGLPARLDPHVFWTPTPNVKPGEYPVDHGTMCAYCAMIAAPQATLLDFPVLQSSRRGGSVMDGVLSDAVTAFSVMLTMMRLPERTRPYHSLIVNNSWGMFHQSWDFPPGHPGRYSDNPKHPFNLIVASLAGAGADILFAAGNCGSDCPDRRCQGVSTGVINGANSHPDVLSVAGVDVSKNRVGYSSQGPGILASQKPDLAAYTHFNGSNAYGVGSADGGTSTACPVAAGCMASLRTRTPPSAVPPANMAAHFRSTAEKPGGGTGHDNDIGYGIINPVGVANALNLAV